MTDQQDGLMGSLRLIRTEPRIHWIAMIAAIVVGVALSTQSWLGIVAGGALVGLVATSIVRAVLAGIGFGVIVILVWMLWLGSGGSLGAVMSMGIFAVIPVAIALGAAILGSLVRGVV